MLLVHHLEVVHCLDAESTKQPKPKPLMFPGVELRAETCSEHGVVGTRY